MKKSILVVLALLGLLLVSCESKKQYVVINVHTETPVSSVNEEVNNEIVNEVVNDNIEYDRNKIYFYLINNELFFTVKDGEIRNDKDSVLTINDIFDNEEYTTFNNIFEGNSKNKYYELSVIKQYSYGDSLVDDVVVNEDSFNYVTSCFNSESNIRTEEGVNDGWFNKIDVYTYKINTKAAKNGDSDAKGLLGVYDGTIKFEDGFATNDNLLIINDVQYSETLSENVGKYIAEFIERNKLDNPKYSVKHYTIDLNDDGENENIYVLESSEDNIDDTIDYYSHSNTISMCLIESEDKIYSVYEGVIPKYSTEKEYFDNFPMGYEEGLKLAFADFNRDGKLEMVFTALEIEPEPFDVYKLVKFDERKVEEIENLEGKNK